MRINITTTIDIETNEDELYITQEQIDEAYNEFHKIIKKAYEMKDLTDFLFINTDTNNEIENEVEE